MALLNWFANALRWGNLRGNLEDQEDLWEELNTKIGEELLGEPDGVATLDANGRVPPDQIPAVALERVVVVADQTERFALTNDPEIGVQNGDWVKQNSDPVEVYIVTDDTELDNPSGYLLVFTASVSPVDSVFGRIGAVVAEANDYDASEINNDSGVAGDFVSDALDTLNSGKAASSHNHDASAITTGQLPLARGGTNATDAAGARTSLSVYSIAEVDTALAGKSDTGHEHSAGDITSGTLPLSRGGTNGTDAAGARTSLDVYSTAEVDALVATPGAHTHDAGDIDSGVLAHERGGLEADVSAYSGLVKISSGATSQASPGTDYYAPGSTDVDVTDGGTGASTASGARTNLEVYSTSEVDTALSGKANSSHNHAASDITSGTLAITRGGTNASDVAGARTNLSVYSTSEVDTALAGKQNAATSLSHIGVLNPSGNGNKFYGVNSGGTGAEFKTEGTHFIGPTQVTVGVTASATDSQGQQQLSVTSGKENVIWQFSTVGSGHVATLPTAVAGLSVLVINSGANALKLYPASGDNLGAGLNTSTTIAAGGKQIFTAYDATNWV